MYISSLIRTRYTAEGLFGPGEYQVLPEISEVPMRSCRDTGRLHSPFFWKAMSRIQWLCNNPRQPEIRHDTFRRVEQVLEELEKRGEDCTLVTHGFLIKSLTFILKKRGYRLTGNSLFGIANLQTITAEK